MVRLAIRPLTPERWPDLERLFGPSGGYSGCWCMYLRVTGREFAANGNAGNRRAFAAVVARGDEPGLLGYDGAEPVGWVGVAPRERTPRVLRSPLCRPERPDADAGPTWAVTCLFVAHGRRGEGVATALVEAAVAHARARGARAVEAYPRRGWTRPAEMWRGRASTFEALGFATVAERKEGRPILRLELARR